MNEYKILYTHNLLRFGGACPWRIIFLAAIVDR